MEWGATTRGNLASAAGCASRRPASRGVDEGGRRRVVSFLAATSTAIAVALLARLVLGSFRRRRRSLPSTTALAVSGWTRCHPDPVLAGVDRNRRADLPARLRSHVASADFGRCRRSSWPPFPGPTLGESELAGWPKSRRHGRTVSRDLIVFGSIGGVPAYGDREPGRGSARSHCARRFRDSRSTH